MFRLFFVVVVEVSGDSWFSRLLSWFMFRLVSRIFKSQLGVSLGKTKHKFRHLVFFFFRLLWDVDLQRASVSWFCFLLRNALRLQMTCVLQLWTSRIQRNSVVLARG